MVSTPNRRLWICFILLFIYNPILHSQSGVKPVSNAHWNYKIFENPDHSFGYDIYSGKTKIIHQATIPGNPGNKGFDSKLNASEVARLVISKLKLGHMPPTVTKEELLKLKQ